MPDLANPYRTTAIKRQAGGVPVPPPDILKDAKTQAVDRAAGAVAPPVPPPKLAATVPLKAPNPVIKFPTQGPALTAPAPASPPAGPRNAFALRREAIQGEAAQNEAARRKAIERALTARGIEDSGILSAQQRISDVDTRKEAGGQLNAVNIEELEQKHTDDQAAILRGWQTGENALDRGVTTRGQDISKEVAVASLKQARDLAERGFGIQETQMKLQEKGMSQEDARYYAGLGQARYLAERGLSIQDAQLELQKKGMEKDEAYRYAALGQAKDLAEKGLTLEQVKIKLQEKGMDQQNAQFFAAQAFEEKMFNKDTTASIQKTIFADMMSKIDAKDPQYLTKITGLIDMFFGAKGILANPVAPVAGNPNTPVVTNPNNQIQGGDVADGYHQGYPVYKEPGGRRYYIQGGSGGRKIYI